MNQPTNSTHSAPSGEPEVSLSPVEGWHCTHFYYALERGALLDFAEEEIQEGQAEIADILDPQRPEAPQRLQTSLVSGQRADFGLMVLDPDPLVVQDTHHRLMASTLGPALEPVYSFVSLTEVSEYVPTVEQYGQRLVEEGEDPASDAYRAKLTAYEKREIQMRRQRLYPDFPPWPATCFYPMNKKRDVGENWFLLPFSRRYALMAEHGRTGMTFGGKVTQLITASAGLDDWEWGVTLWARNPQFLKEIVYRMRFDEASARYAQFGPFYASYIMPPEEMLNRLRLT